LVYYYFAIALTIRQTDLLHGYVRYHCLD
jgi:hypothetical protein